MPPHSRPSDMPSAMVEAIASAYLEAAGDDAVTAIRAVIADALADLCEAERRSLRRDRLISRGYVRGRPDRDGG